MKTIVLQVDWSVKQRLRKNLPKSGRGKLAKVDNLVREA